MESDVVQFAAFVGLTAGACAGYILGLWAGHEGGRAEAARELQDSMAELAKIIRPQAE